MMPQTPMDDKAELLRMENVSIVFSSPDEADIEAVRQVDFTLTRGKTLALVSESGCGKSVTARTILRLLDRNARIGTGRILLARAEVARDVLPYGLRAAGWDVDVVVAYRNVEPDNDPDTLAAAREADAGPG